MRYMKQILNLLLAIGGVTLVGCASITQGTSQVINFKLDPPETKCSITSDKNVVIGSVTSSLNTMQVSKGHGDLIASCTADNFQQKTTRIVSSTQTAGVIGVVIDFGITDMLTGAMWKYPDTVSISLDKSTPNL